MNSLGRSSPTQDAKPKKAKRNAAVRTAYHHGDLIAALVAAGRALLEEDGIAGLSLRGAARRVGVTQTAPLHHFGNKAGLLAAVAAEGYRELTAIRRETSARVADPAERIREHVRLYVAFARENRGLFHLMFGHELDRKVSKEITDASQETYQIFAADVKSFVEARGWPKERSALAVATAWAVEHGLANLILNNQVPVPMDRVRLDDLVQSATDALLAGLEAMCIEKKVPKAGRP